MKRTLQQAFTLIELLVVIAIIAILAAILFPVFAQAKYSAKVASSLSNTKQQALGSIMYSADVDDMVVYFYGYATAADSNIYHNDNGWAGKVFPYVKNQEIFFDTLKPKPQPDITNAAGKFYSDGAYPGSYEYSWSWITNISINADGYSTTAAGTCTSPNFGTRSARSQTAIEEPASRMAFAPTQYSTKNQYGWLYFYGYQAAWPTTDWYATGYDNYNIVWDSRSRYTSGKFVAAYADGHASKFGREKFVHYFNNPANGTTEAANLSQFCTVFVNKGLDKFWGSAWQGN